MPTVKTAISVEPELLSKVGALAIKLNISRSRLFALAAEDFVHRQSSRELTERLNQVYNDGPDAEEQEMIHHMRATHRRITEGEW